MIPFPAENVDTDQIIPARYLKTTEKTGLASVLFNDWRYLPDGTPNPDFVLNRPEMQGRKILLAGANFGCGLVAGARAVGADGVGHPAPSSRRASPTSSATTR